MAQTYEEYEKGRQPILDRQADADKDIHKYEKLVDQDVRLGDVKTAQYDWNKMKDAENRFDKASEDLAEYDKNYWGKKSGENSNSAESGKSNEDEKQNEAGNSI